MQKYLKKVVDYLGYEEPIGSHSFRKYFATEIYRQNNYDIVLVQKLLQHSSVATTQRYIDVDQRIDKLLLSSVRYFKKGKCAFFAHDFSHLYTTGQKGRCEKTQSPC